MSLLEIHEPGETPLPHAGEASLAVGIDLGTTNSVVAIARAGVPAALHDEAGNALVPSVVAYPEAGGVLVGEDARLLMAREPRNAVASIKRLMQLRRLPPSGLRNSLALPRTTFVELQMNLRPPTAPWLMDGWAPPRRHSARQTSG